jgi:hypothetical protein
MAAAAAAPVITSAGIFGSGTSDLSRESQVAQQPSGTATVLPRQQRGQAYPEPNVHVEILPAADAPNPRPSKVLFGGLQDPGVQVIRPIPVDVSVEESTVVVHWAEIDEFGTGENLSCALDDFSHTVRELYHHLNSGETKPGADLLRVKQVLGDYIEPRTK